MFISKKIVNEDSEINIIKPPLKGNKVAGEIIVGAFVGAGSAVIGTFALFGITKLILPNDDGTTAAILGFISGYIIGSAMGVYHIGNTENETGSFSSTLLGSTIGAIFFLIPAPVGATIGFNMTREYRNNSPDTVGLIQFNNKKISLAFPETYTNYDYINCSKSISLKIIKINL